MKGIPLLCLGFLTVISYTASVEFAQTPVYDYYQVSWMDMWGADIDWGNIYRTKTQVILAGREAINRNQSRCSTLGIGGTFYWQNLKQSVNTNPSRSQTLCISTIFYGRLLAVDLDDQHVFFEIEGLDMWGADIGTQNALNLVEAQRKAVELIGKDDSKCAVIQESSNQVSYKNWNETNPSGQKQHEGKRTIFRGRTATLP